MYSNSICVEHQKTSHFRTDSLKGDHQRVLEQVQRHRWPACSRASAETLMSQRCSGLTPEHPHLDTTLRTSGGKAENDDENDEGHVSYIITVSHCPATNERSK